MIRLYTRSDGQLSTNKIIYSKTTQSLQTHNFHHPCIYSATLSITSRLPTILNPDYPTKTSPPTQASSNPPRPQRSRPPASYQLIKKHSAQPRPFKTALSKEPPAAGRNSSDSSHENKGKYGRERDGLVGKGAAADRPRSADRYSYRCPKVSRVSGRREKWERERKMSCLGKRGSFNEI